MICAPVIIPTLCRYEHFKRCIESLSHCTNAEHTEVYVGLDYPAKETHWDGYNKIRDYLAHCGDLGFKKIIVIKRDRNYGIGENGNYDTLRRFILTKYDTYISTEDDNIFAPCFLDFMNKSLIFYKNDPKISSVSGYLQYHIKYSSEGNGVYLTPFVTAWGMGHWKHKEMDLCQRNEFAIQLFKSIKWRFQIWKFSPNLYRMMCNMVFCNKMWGDVSYSIYNMHKQQYQIRPQCNLVRNNGFDNSGQNCSNSKYNDYATQQISSMLSYPSVQSKRDMPWHVFFFYNIGKNTFMALWRALKDLIYVINPTLLSHIYYEHKQS